MMNPIQFPFISRYVTLSEQVMKRRSVPTLTWLCLSCDILLLHSAGIRPELVAPLTGWSCSSTRLLMKVRCGSPDVTGGEGSKKKSHAGPHDAPSSLGKHAPGETSSTKSTSELWSELIMKHSNGKQKRWRSVRLRSPDVRQSLFGLPAAPQKIWTTVKLNGNQMSHQQSAHPSYFSSIHYCVSD